MHIFCTNYAPFFHVHFAELNVHPSFQKHILVDPSLLMFDDGSKLKLAKIHTRLGYSYLSARSQCKRVFGCRIL